MQRPLKKARFKKPVVIWLSAFLTLLLGLLIFGILLIRREAVEYYLDYQFTVKDPEFFPSAHALSDPLPVAGNKIELLHNGKKHFRAGGSAA